VLAFLSQSKNIAQRNYAFSILPQTIQKQGKIIEREMKEDQFPILIVQGFSYPISFTIKQSITELFL
jgi:hypothetical protein